MYSATREGDKLASSSSVPPYRRFSLEEIHSATDDFDDDLVIGEGGFGKVYKGEISSGEAGHVVAIKRLSSRSNQGEHEFRAEIETLSNLRHCHLVSLIGYCDDKDEMILVYEYMQNGTLYNHLHKPGRGLNWVERIKIAIGAGRGLDYLHTGVGTKEGIVHRDVKSSNILLDENMEAMISDFGLSKLNPIDQSSSGVVASVKRTFGYLDPEYFYTKKLSRKTDVYAFGVVLFELLSGRLAVDERLGDEQCSLVIWAKKCVRERKLEQMVDSSIIGTIFPKCLRRFAQIADSCVHITPQERPTMTKVVASLHGVLELQLKFDSPAKSSGIMGFTWKTRMHFPPVAKYLSQLRNPEMDIIIRTLSFFLEIIGTSSSTNPGKDEECSSDHEIIHHGEDIVLKGIIEFTHDEIRHATGNFQDTCLGKGTGREVYKGWVDNLTYSPCNYNSGLLVAVKRFHLYKHFDQQMLRECNHPNLVKLIGYCMQDESLFLVYEFMHNGNFEDLLRRGVVARLPLVKKVQIAFGVARGIRFLKKMRLYFGTYSRKCQQLLERRCIMLNKDFIAKLSDYGVTLTPSEPSQSHTLRATDLPNGEPLQMDLSGFTVILAELVTGKNMNENEINKIDKMLRRHGKLSLRHVAKSCYESCYGVESESKMLEKEYAMYIPALENCEDETCYTANFDDHEVDTFYTATSDQGDDDAFSTATLDRQDDTFCTATSGEREDDTLSAVTLEHQDDTFSTTTLEECQDETFSVTSFESCL